MSAQEIQTRKLDEAQAKALNKRLDGVGWALFLIMIGGLALVPKGWLPDGLWLVGTGLIMLGINYIRFLNGVKTNGGTIVLGILALLAGMGEVFGANIPTLAILLILLGLHALLKIVFEKD